MAKRKFKETLIKRLGGYTANEVEEIKKELKEKSDANNILEEHLNIAESSCDALDAKLREIESSIKIVTVKYAPKTDVDEAKANQALIKRLSENADFKNSLIFTEAVSTNSTPQYSLSTGIIRPSVFYGETFNGIHSK